MTTPIRVPDHERRVRPSPHAPHYVAPDTRHELSDVHASDETVGRACALAGLIHGLPPIPAALGAGASVPDRRAENGILIPPSGTRRAR